MLAGPSGADVLASDFSPNMVERLQHRLRDAGISNARAEVMDGQDLKLADGSRISPSSSSPTSGAASWKCTASSGRAAGLQCLLGAAGPRHVLAGGEGCSAGLRPTCKTSGVVAS